MRIDVFDYQNFLNIESMRLYNKLWCSHDLSTTQLFVYFVWKKTTINP